MTNYDCSSCKQLLKRIDWLETENKELHGLVKLGRKACQEQTKLAKENLKMIEHLQYELKTKDEEIERLSKSDLPYGGDGPGIEDEYGGA